MNCTVCGFISQMKKLKIHLDLVTSNVQFWHKSCLIIKDKRCSQNKFRFKIMEMINVNYFDEINQQFELSWKKLSEIADQVNIHEDKTRRSVKKLHRCLKWCNAYAFLQSYCGNIIKSYSSHYAILIKKFWIEYGERNFYTDLPPTPAAFFEWYCDSRTIHEERTMFQNVLNS